MYLVYCGGAYGLIKRSWSVCLSFSCVLRHYSHLRRSASVTLSLVCFCEYSTRLRKTFLHLPQHTRLACNGLGLSCQLTLNLTLCIVGSGWFRCWAEFLAFTYCRLQIWFRLVSGRVYLTLVGLHMLLSTEFTGPDNDGLQITIPAKCRA